MLWIRIRTSENGSGSGSCNFRQWPSRWQLKRNLFSKFFAYNFLKLHLHNFSKIKNHKEVTKQWNQGFSYYFCLMIKRSGSIPRTKGSGSGSGEAQNIQNIRILQIRNTGFNRKETYFGARKIQAVHLLAIKMIFFTFIPFCVNVFVRRAQLRPELVAKSLLVSLPLPKPLFPKA